MNSCGNVVFPKYSLPRAEHKADNVGLRNTEAAVVVSPSVGGEGGRKQVWKEMLPTLLKKQSRDI